jgi:hypothetical protein
MAQTNKLPLHLRHSWSGVEESLGTASSGGPIHEPRTVVEYGTLVDRPFLRFVHVWIKMYLIGQHVLLPGIASRPGLFGKIVLRVLGLLLVPGFYDNFWLDRFVLRLSMVIIMFDHFNLWDLKDILNSLQNEI